MSGRRPSRRCVRRRPGLRVGQDRGWHAGRAGRGGMARASQPRPCPTLLHTAAEACPATRPAPPLLPADAGERRQRGGHDRHCFPQHLQGRPFAGECSLASSSQPGSEPLQRAPAKHALRAPARRACRGPQREEQRWSRMQAGIPRRLAGTREGRAGSSRRSTHPPPTAALAWPAGAHGARHLQARPAGGTVREDVAGLHRCAVLSPHSTRVLGAGWLGRGC